MEGTRFEDRSFDVKPQASVFLSLETRSPAACRESGMNFSEQPQA